jgi:hypothetical protein
MDYESSKKNITTFLDEMVDKLVKAKKQDLDLYDKTFRTSMQRCWRIFENAAFEKRSADTKNKRRRKNSTLFEVWSIALAKLKENEINLLIQRKKELIDKHLQLMSVDNEYFRSITYSTQKRDHFRIRRNKVNHIIEEVLNA